jgi:hypothetical protein
LLKPIALPDVLEFGVTPKPVDAGVLRALTANLMDYLVSYFIDACASATTNKLSEIDQAP